jgi:hypothetical protein
MADRMNSFDSLGTDKGQLICGTNGKTWIDMSLPNDYIKQYKLPRTEMTFTPDGKWESNSVNGCLSYWGEWKMQEDRLSLSVESKMSWDSIDFRIISLSKNEMELEKKKYDYFFQKDSVIDIQSFFYRLPEPFPAGKGKLTKIDSIAMKQVYRYKRK